MRAYKDHKYVVEMPGLLRALNLACAFVLTAEKDMATTSNFYQMLHGEAQETIEIDGRRLLYNNETLSSEENFFWDTTCLLLEESATERELPQYAYDIAGRYVMLAYNHEVIDDAPSEVIAPNPCVVSAPVSASVPQQATSAIDLLQECQRLREEIEALRQENQSLREKSQADCAEKNALREENRWLRKMQQNTMEQMIAAMQKSIGNHANNFNGPATSNGGTMTGDVNDPRNKFNL